MNEIAPPRQLNRYTAFITPRLIAMGIINKLFGRGDSATRADQWNIMLANCDLLMARQEIIDMHQILSQQGEREGGAYLFKQEYVAAWETFRDNPNIDTARSLLNVAPMLRDYFEGCCPGGNLYVANHYFKNHGLK